MCAEVEHHVAITGIEYCLCSKLHRVSSNGQLASCWLYIILYSNVHDMLLFYDRCASKRFNNVLSTSSSRYSDLIDCALLGYAAPTKFSVTPG